MAFDYSLPWYARNYPPGSDPPLWSFNSANFAWMFQLNSEVFFMDPDVALAEILHEPMHDVWPGAWGVGHLAFEDMFPLAWLPGRKNAYDDLINFLKNKKCENGKTEWENILTSIGPKP